MYKIKEKHNFGLEAFMFGHFTVNTVSCYITEGPPEIYLVKFFFTTIVVILLYLVIYGNPIYKIK